MKNMIAYERPKTQAIFLLQRGRCAICGEVMHPARGNAHHPRGWTIEHVVPLAEGGGRRGNLVLTHSVCNNKKGGDMPLGYLKRIANDLHEIYRHLAYSKARLNQRQKDILNGGGIEH